MKILNTDAVNAMTLLGRVSVVAVALTLAACSSTSDRTGRAPTVSKPAPKAPSKRMPRAATGKGINLAGNCDQREVDGFEEQAVVKVSAGRVRKLTWRMKIGRKGTCEFNGEEFRQTKLAPTIELTAKDGSGCRLLMWSDPRRVTLAHNGCAKFCTPSAVYDKAWPVMFDPRTGGCAKTNK